MKKTSIVALTAAAILATTVSPISVQAGTKNSIEGFSKCKPKVIISGVIKPQQKPESNPENKPDTDTKPENTPEQDAVEVSFEEQVVKLVNEERAKAGLGALTLDKQIAAAAQVRAKETEQSFSHTRPNGTSFSTALKEQGVTYRGAGENIAWGQKTPEEVMRAWMNSEGHRANILNAKYTKIGVGYYKNAQGRNYWTQLFTY